MVGNFKPQVPACALKAPSVRLKITAARAAEPPRAMCVRSRSVSSAVQDL
jgi:hypothetical protein